HDEALKLETRVNSSATTPSGRTSAEPRPVAYKFDFDGNSAGFTEKAAVPVPGHAVAARSQVGVAQQAGMGQALGAEAGGTRAAPSRERVASKEARTKLKREIWHDLVASTDGMGAAQTLETLGVVVDNGVHASREDLQRAYRKAAIKFHPDRHQDAVLRVQVYHECALKLVQEKMN
ncbi:copper transport protein ctr1, partial [Cymbomonas tetramitiformis]